LIKEERIKNFRGSSMSISIEEVIERIPSWKDKELRYEPLGGGITNHNYTVYIGKEEYVVRIPGAGTEIFINRENELDCSIKTGNAGIAPKVIHHLKPEHVTVVQFIRGETLKTSRIAGDDNLIKRIVNSIRTLHEKVVFKSTFDPFETVRNYMHYVKLYSVPLPDDIEWMFKVAERIEMAMQREKPRSTACHNDYLSENFLDDGEKIWIIDWEYGGMGDPYFDLGDFAVEHPFTREQEELIIKEYCGEMKKRRLYRMLLLKIVSDLWWGVWAMIQSKISKIDFDFCSYAHARFERLRNNTHDDDFETWIETV
jgi:thiamine kinase-like enzyme